MAYIPNENEILLAVKNSGYLFEQEIATLFEKNDFYIRTNSAFLDQDEEVSREMDFIGFKRVLIKQDPQIYVNIRVIAECKNSKNPYVFINRNKSKVDDVYNPPNFLFPDTYDKQKISDNGSVKSISLNGFNYFDIRSIYPYTASKSKAVQFCKVTTNGKKVSVNHDSIYDGLFYPLIKCLEYYKKKDKSYYNKDYYVYFPIVVVNSKLYYIDSQKENHELVPTKHISLTRHIDSIKYKDHYLLDFVSFEGVQDYIDNNITKFIKAFINRLDKF